MGTRTVPPEGIGAGRPPQGRLKARAVPVDSNAMQNAPAPLTGGETQLGTPSPAQGQVPALAEPAQALAEPAQSKRVLFVTDEAATSGALRGAFLQQPARWQGVLVASGAAALAELDRNPFDAIVCELRLPQMDGAQLLAQVCERHPNVVRLCLSDAADEDLVLRAMPVTHQFLSKPCNTEVVQEVVAGAGGSVVRSSFNFGTSAHTVTAAQKAA